MRADPRIDVREDRAGVVAVPPVRQRVKARAVREIERDVARARLRRGLDRDRAPRDLGAQRARLAQRQAALAPAADIDRDARPVVGVQQLALDQRDEVLDVQQVANLPSSIGASAAQTSSRRF